MRKEADLKEEASKNSSEQIEDLMNKTREKKQRLPGLCFALLCFGSANVRNM